MKPLYILLTGHIDPVSFAFFSIIMLIIIN